MCLEAKLQSHPGVLPWLASGRVKKASSAESCLGRVTQSRETGRSCQQNHSVAWSLVPGEHESPSPAPQISEGPDHSPDWSTPEMPSSAPLNCHLGEPVECWPKTAGNRSRKHPKQVSSDWDPLKRQQPRSHTSGLRQVGFLQP